MKTLLTGGIQVSKRIKLISSFFMLGILTMALGCSTKSTEEPTQSKNTVPNSQDLFYKFENMDKVNVKKDIVYKNDNGNELKLDVYYALGNKDISKTPTIILVHGSAPGDNLKDSSVYTTWGDKIASSGFNAVMFNWRPSGPLGDVSYLIKYIRENANELKINSENISVIAFSAGVYEGVKEVIEVNTGFIKNVAVYYGCINSSILTTKTDVKLPSFFIAMAALDKIVPPDINDDFISKAEEAGCNVIKMVHSKAGHGFDAFNAYDDETKIIIDKTLKFIEDGSNS